MSEQRHEDDTAWFVLHVQGDEGDLTKAQRAAARIRERHSGTRVTIVVAGDAVRELPGAQVAEGTTIQACSIALHRRGVAADALPDGAEAVDTALDAIVDAELAGARYIRL